MHKYNNCVKVQFEIGHEAYLRSEVTPQGFTHDWQVFVRGADNTEIHHFVEKVVFNLHDSFPKPRRVVKEPPYEVKESGYASFAFPIEVYLKTKDEPRKLDFNYDLQLNTNGPVRSSQREKRVFNNPSEEFRRKLIRGGGVGVGSDMLPLTDNSQNTDKISSKKSSTDSTKKHKSKESLKPEEVRPSSQFADLFGTPIKKLSPTTVAKKSADSKHSSDGKVASKSASKHSPHKEREKDKDSTKKDLMNNVSKEKDKDRDKSREKDKKQDKILKRPPSPTVQPPAKIIKEEAKKSSYDEVKEREKKSVNDITKNEKKEKKKDKKNRDEKDKKDRHKDHESKKDIPPVPPPPPPTLPIVEKEKEKPAEKSTDKVKSEYKETKENFKKSPKHIIKEEKVKEKIEKDKVDPIEKQRHKHKKKEKNKKEEKEVKEKDKAMKKVEKQPPAPVHVPKEPTPPPQPPPQKTRPRSPSPKASKNPLSALMNEMSDKGSDSESSGEEDTGSVNNEREKATPPPPPPPPPAPTPPANRTPDRVKEEKLIKEKVKKKEKKSSSKDEDGSRKKKRKNKDQDQIVPEKTLKVKAESEKIMKDEPVNEDEEERFSEPSSVVGSPPREDISRSPSPPKFTEEYVMELKDLQQKIMTLEDNAELQRVVQVIAETGQYEITKKTFDFDLCALDKSTVRRLQDLFFAAS